VGDDVPGNRRRKRKILSGIRKLKHSLRQVKENQLIRDLAGTNKKRAVNEGVFRRILGVSTRLAKLEAKSVKEIVLTRP